MASYTELPDGAIEVQVWVKDANGKPLHPKKVFDPKGRRRGAVKGGRRAAETWAAKQKSLSDDGMWIDLSDTTTVCEMFLRWLRNRPGHRDTTRDTYEGFAENQLKGTPLGRMPYVKARPSHVQAWVTDRAQYLETSTLKNRAGMLRSAFAAAVDDGKLARNPVPVPRNLSWPEDNREEYPALTVGQVLSWAYAVPEHAYYALIVQAGTGMRMSELRALRECDYDRDRKVITVRDQLGKAGGKRLPVKNSRRKAARNREIPVLPFVARALAAQMLAQPPGGPDGLIFPGSTRTGGWSSTRMGEDYAKGREAAGIELPPNQNTHALRHHFISVMLAASVPITEVAAWAGDTVQVIANTYAHVVPGSLTGPDGKPLYGREGVNLAWQYAQAAAEAGARNRRAAGID